MDQHNTFRKLLLFNVFTLGLLLAEAAFCQFGYSRDPSADLRKLMTLVIDRVPPMQVWHFDGLRSPKGEQPYLVYFVQAQGFHSPIAMKIYDLPKLIEQIESYDELPKPSATGDSHFFSRHERAEAAALAKLTGWDVKVFEKPTEMTFYMESSDGLYSPPHGVLASQVLLEVRQKFDTGKGLPKISKRGKIYYPDYERSFALKTAASLGFNVTINERNTGIEAEYSDPTNTDVKFSTINGADALYSAIDGFLGKRESNSMKLFKSTYLRPIKFQSAARLAQFLGWKLHQAMFTPEGAIEFIYTKDHAIYSTRTPQTILNQFESGRKGAIDQGGVLRWERRKGQKVQCDLELGTSLD